MNKEDKLLWLQALKSGEFIKGEGVLCTQIEIFNKPLNSFCCLGVLGKVKNFPFYDSGEQFKGTSTEMSEQYPAIYPLLLKECGLSDEHQYELYIINDSTDTFEKVIEYIEKNIPEE